MYDEEGVHVPVFLISSISGDCNLVCKGCYAHTNHICGAASAVHKRELPPQKWRSIFEEAARLGINFNLLVGGEPLLRKEIIEIAAQVKDLIFPIFTNGTLLDGEYIDLFADNLNLIPILSMEGGLEETDARRGAGVYDKLMAGMGRLNARKLFYGVSFTVTSSNIRTVTSAAFIDNLFSLGCRLIFFVEYVPTDPKTVNLELNSNEVQELASILDDLRQKYKNMIILSFPGDEKEMGGCLAAGRGFFHISPSGKAEACPFSPYSDRSVADAGLKEALKSPFFEKLRNSGLVGGEHEGGCVLFEREGEVRGML